MAVLVGCAPRQQPSGAALVEPQLTPLNLVTDDAVSLPLRVWMPAATNPTAPRAVIVALHGFNDYSNAFDGPAQIWADAGIVTYAYDQRGFGGAIQPGLWAGTERMTADAALAVKLVAARHPGVPVFLVGESMGGAVALALMTGPKPPDIAGTILVAPAVRGRDAIGLVASATLWFATHTVPWWEVTGRGLDIRPSDNIPMLIALSRDPLVIKRTRVDTIYGLVGLMDQALAAAPHLPRPTLVLYGTHEEVISAEAADAFLAALPKDGAAPIRVAIYEGGYHMLLRDLGGRRVIDDIAAWIADPARPLPSGADRNGRDRVGG
jgi:alpha-beta hydrolase superfamily lysophospholipase